MASDVRQEKEGQAIRSYIPDGVATFYCPGCGRRTGWYRGVGRNRAARVCEHDTPAGGRCPLSRKLLTDRIC
jgi:hypothetical protein